MHEPSQSEIFVHLLEMLRLSEEAAYILGHYYKAQDDFNRGQGFLALGEMFKMTQKSVTAIATEGSK